jgi:HEAT repeat protein
MPVDMEQVKAALYPEEPDYPKAAKQLGAEALPHLEKIIGGSDTSLAAKATYLAGLIGGESSAAAVAKAARSSQAPVRIAAAAAARHLPAEHSDAVLLQLVDDADGGVQKVALRSAPSGMSDALRARVSALASSEAAAAPSKAPARRARKSGRTAKKGVRKTAKKAARKGTRKAR